MGFNSGFKGLKFTATSGGENYPHRAVNALRLSYKILYREIIALCSQIHTKHINTLCGLNAELLKLKLVVHIATSGL